MAEKIVNYRLRKADGQVVTITSDGKVACRGQTHVSVSVFDLVVEMVRAGDLSLAELTRVAADGSYQTTLAGMLTRNEQPRRRYKLLPTGDVPVHDFVNEWELAYLERRIRRYGYAREFDLLETLNPERAALLVASGVMVSKPDLLSAPVVSEYSSSLRSSLAWYCNNRQTAPRKMLVRLLADLVNYTKVSGGSAHRLAEELVDQVVSDFDRLQGEIEGYLEYLREHQRVKVNFKNWRDHFCATIIFLATFRPESLTKLRVEGWSLLVGVLNNIRGKSTDFNCVLHLEYMVQVRPYYEHLLGK